MGPVIVGYIDTAAGRAAVTVGAGEARLRGTGLLLALHEELSGTARRSPEDEERNRELEAHLDEVRAEFAADDLDAETVVLRTTHDAGAALADLAGERGASLLVIGLRRRSRVGKLLLGSTAQSALMRAECPVMGVKADTVG